MRRAFEAGIVDPPAVGVDRRATATQSGMMNLFGKSGVLPPPQDHRQFSSESLSTMTMPASTSDVLGNPRAENVAAVVEMKMIFTSLNEEAVILGPRGVSPLTYTDKHAFEVNIMRWNSLMPDRRPIRGRVRMGTYDRESRTGTLASYGVGFEMPLQFFMDMEGPMYFRMAIEQINIGVRDFLILLVYNMLEAAIDWGSRMWKEKMDLEGTRRFLSMNDWLLRERRMLGVLQRDSHPIENIINFMDEQQRQLGNFKSNILLANHRIGRFVQTEIRSYNEFFRAGERGPALLNSSPDAALAKFSMPVHVVRSAVIDDVSEFDFMTGNRRYGEYVEMINFHTQSPAHPYRTEWRTVYIMDSNTDDWQPVTLRDALLYSGRFHVDPRTGQPTDAGGKGALRNMSDAGAGWREQLTSINGTPSDPFHKFSSGYFVPITTWQDLLDARHFTVADVAFVAEAIQHNDVSLAGITSQIGVERIGGSIEEDKAEIIDIVKEIDAAPYSDEYARLLAGTIVEGRLPFAPRRFAAPPFLASTRGLAAIARAYADNPSTFESSFNISSAFGARVNALYESIARRDGNFVDEVGRAIGVRPRLLRQSVSSSVLSSAAPDFALAQIKSVIGVGAAVGLSHDARKLVEQNLTGAWKTTAAGLVPEAEAVTAPLGRLGLLRSSATTGALDTAASDRNALSALALVHNYGYVNPANPEGTLHTEHMRGLVLSGLAAINTTGTPEQVSARIGAYIGWLNAGGHVPANVASRSLPEPVAQTAIPAFQSALKSYLATENVAAEVFGGDTKKLISALSKTSRAANVMSADSVRSKMAAASTAMVGDPLSGPFEPINFTSYSPSQAAVYDQLANAPGYVPTVELEDPTNPGQPLSASGRAAFVRSAGISLASGGGGSATSARALTTPVTITNALRGLPRALIANAEEFLKKSVSWTTIEAFLAYNVPVLLRPVIMRPQILLSTAGMIATATGGAQRTYYAKPLFTWEEDGAQQVSRATLSFWAGSFMVEPRSTYHIRDVLITGVLGGFDMTFATGGMNGDFGAVDEKNQMAESKSIIVVVEPYRPAAPMDEIITAYGSWNNLAQVVGSIPVKDVAKNHFANVHWMAMWFGISPKSSTHSSEAAAAWGSALAPENLSMWRGGSRHFNPTSDKYDDHHNGSGALAGWFYNTGMFTAWNTGTAYPAQSSTQVLVN